MAMICKNVCTKYKAKKHCTGIGINMMMAKHLHAPRYLEGQKRCSCCEIYMDYAGLRCPCCGSKLRTSPLKSAWKKPTVRYE